MSDATTAPTASASSVPKRAKGKAAIGVKKPRVRSTHPKTSDMVNAAIENLKERGGSSLRAIKKYISANYKVDAEKMAPFIRRYLKGAVTNGALVQIKGKGASGSFKLVAAGEKSKVAKKTAKPKAVAAKKTKMTRPKKSSTTTPKKAPAKPKAAKPSPSKAKKTTKTPTKKPKAPKPKKAAPKKK